MHHGATEPRRGLRNVSNNVVMQEWHIGVGHQFVFRLNGCVIHDRSMSLPWLDQQLLPTQELCRVITGPNL